MGREATDSLWLCRLEAMTPLLMCWLALGEPVDSMLVPLPGHWAWTLCASTGMSGSREHSQGGQDEWGWSWLWEKPTSH